MSMHRDLSTAVAVHATFNEAVLTGGYNWKHVARSVGMFVWCVFLVVASVYFLWTAFLEHAALYGPVSRESLRVVVFAAIGVYSLHSMAHLVALRARLWWWAY